MTRQEVEFDRTDLKFMPESTQEYYLKHYGYEGTKVVYTEFPKVFPIIDKNTGNVAAYLLIEKSVAMPKYDAKSPFMIGEQLTHEEREKFLSGDEMVSTVQAE